MNRNHRGLRIVARPVSAGIQRHSAAGIPIGIVMLLGMAITFCAWFPSVPVRWYILFAAMLVGAAALWLLQLTGKGRWICLGALVLTMLACAVFHKSVLGGIGGLGNDVLDRLTAMTGRIYLDFAWASAEDILWGVIPLLITAVLLLHLSLQTGRLLFVFPILLPVYAAALTGFYPVDAGVVLLGLGILLLLLNRSGASAYGLGFRGVPTWIAVVLLCCALAVGAGMLLGDADAKTAQWDKLLHERLYDQETNSMPEGELKNLRPWNKSEQPALEITMSQPQKLYLRGQIFETYDGTAWSEADPAMRAEHEDLFYWLHQSGFYGQSQIGTASAYTTQAAPAELTVRNVSACTAHGYYPYALSGSAALDAALIGDGELPVAETMQYYPGSVPEWYAVQQSLASAQGRTNISDYLRAEQAYEEYVAAMDLQLTNASWSVLERQFGQEHATLTLSEIRAFVGNWLEENLTYDEKIRTRSGNNDFLQYTLEQSGSGYSVHYATAATLMLRYFGVPARYVEGYFLSAEEAASYRAGEPIILTEAHAHAWTEYYLPGVGFIPFEVTPGYIDDEEVELAGELTQNEQTYTGEHMKYAQVEQPEHIEEPEQKRFSFSFKPLYLLFLLIPLVLALVIVVIVKRTRFQKAICAIDAAPNREAIAMRFGYALRLLQSCGALTADGTARAESLKPRSAVQQP